VITGTKFNDMAICEGTFEYRTRLPIFEYSYTRTPDSQYSLKAVNSRCFKKEIRSNSRKQLFES